MRRVLCACGLVCLVASPVARADGAPVADDVLVRAMRDELTRSASDLHLPDAPKPYYLALRFNDRSDVVVVASFGAVVARTAARGRYLQADVRVGDYALDNSNFGTRPGMSLEKLPLDDDYDAIRHDVWHTMDGAYKQAAADYARKAAVRKTQNQSPDDVGDFSREAPARIVAARPLPAPDVERAASTAKDISALAREFPEIQSSEVTVFGGSSRRIFLSSEGGFVDESSSLVTLTATLRTQAIDGMPLSRRVWFSAASIDALPAHDVLEHEVRRAAEELTALRAAQGAEDYAGPVLFEAPAAAQLLRAVLAPQLSGMPAPTSEADGPTGRSGMETELSGRVGERVMPAGFRVEDDPTIDHVGPLALVGGYAADDEGMAGQKVTLVEHGALERFLMSRAPRKGFEHSNGHARAALFMTPRPSVSNLVVSADGGSSAVELRKKLLAEAKAEKLPYAIVVKWLDDEATGGGHGNNVPPPVALVKVTADGKEQPVRGATFGPLPLRAFEEILAAGREPAVVTRTTPNTTSVVSPALLFKRVEIKRPMGPQRKLPVLPHPYFVDRDAKAPHTP